MPGARGTVYLRKRAAKIKFWIFKNTKNLNVSAHELWCLWNSYREYLLTWLCQCVRGFYYGWQSSIIWCVNSPIHTLYICGQVINCLCDYTHAYLHVFVAFEARMGSRTTDKNKLTVDTCSKYKLPFHSKLSGHKSMHKAQREGWNKGRVVLPLQVCENILKQDVIPTRSIKGLALLLYSHATPAPGHGDGPSQSRGQQENKDTP